MDIKEFLSPGNARVDLTVSDKGCLLKELADRAGSSLCLSADRILSELPKREKLGSTGTVGGIAIPHARIPGLDKPFGIFVRLKQPVDFDAIDSQPIDLLFVLLLPAAPDKQQLNALAFVSRILRNSESVRRPRGSCDSEGLFRTMVLDSARSGE